jgi:hypothetical protein
MANIIAEETLCFYTTHIFCCRNMLYGCRPSVDNMFSVPWFNRSNRYRAFQRSNYIICRVLWTLIPFGSINIFQQASIVNYLYVLLRKRNVHTTRHSHGRYIVITQLLPVLFLWSLDRLYIILYFFFGHWILCTLCCTFSLVIGLSVLYFVLFLWSLDCLYFIFYFFFSHWIVCTLFCTFSLVIGLSVLYFVLFLWSLDCLYFMLYFFFSHWIVCTLFCTFSLVIGLSVLYFVLFL